MVKNAREALQVACEMEKRAIRMYQRGQMLFPHLKEHLAQYEQEERSHLRRFGQMGEALAPAGGEDQVLISAYAAQVLFPGGLMEASREKAFSDLGAFLQYAAQQEAEAIQTYQAFAQKCQEEDAKTMFMAIAQEEEGHYQALVARQEKA
ncbi:MAG: hypothetical protein IJ461_09090 [Clostridia bacterium]|nr:hypothetical protein [Clostridia bacterium]